MKRYNYFLPVLCVLFIASCELDNYKAPDSSFHGTILDADTREPILQDMIQGSEIDVIELGYENPNTQTFRFNTDGSFRNDQMFAGRYVVQPLRGNFFTVAADTIGINGDTEYHFESRPYIRINNAEIAFDELKGQVVATFSLERVSGNAVEKVVLLADKNPNVGIGIRAATASVELNRAVGSEEVLTLKMSSLNLTSGESYYFRIGALIADVSQAKYNFSSAVRLDIDNSQVVPEPEIEGKSFDDCESLNEWGSDFTLSLDGDSKQGDYSIRAEGEGVVIYQKTMSSIFDATTEVDRETGHFAFSLYISDVSKINLDGPDNGIEISSSGAPDNQELGWKLDGSLDLVSGWNDLVFSLKDGIDSGGTIDLSAINFMRIYHTGMSGSLVFKIDNIRFY